jgi:hypothetical protein
MLELTVHGKSVKWVHWSAVHCCLSITNLQQGSFGLHGSRCIVHGLVWSLMHTVGLLGHNFRQWELPADADLDTRPVSAQLHAAPPAASEEGSEHSKLVLNFGKKEHDGELRMLQHRGRSGGRLISICWLV